MNYVDNRAATGQRRDCTIRALASLTNTSYQRVELLLATAGKVDDRGFDIYGWLDQHGGKVLGCQFTLVRRYEKLGRFLIGNNRHVRALINNISHDSYDRGMSYRWCYRVELNAGYDTTLATLDRLQSQGFTTLNEWKSRRKSIIDNL